jgi:hypothetical protein
MGHAKYKWKKIDPEGIRIVIAIHSVITQGNKRLVRNIIRLMPLRWPWSSFWQRCSPCRQVEDADLLVKIYEL